MIGCRRDTADTIPSPGQRYGTFSYLPGMDAMRIRKQIEYIVRQNWNPVIEHVEPGRVTDHYWYMWKLPMFGERDIAPILAEIAACREAYPDHYVRIVGYDNGRQTQGARIVVYQGGRGGTRELAESIARS